MHPHKQTALPTWLTSSPDASIQTYNVCAHRSLFSFSWKLAKWDGSSTRSNSCWAKVCSRMYNDSTWRNVKLFASDKGENMLNCSNTASSCLQKQNSTITLTLIDVYHITLPVCSSWHRPIWGCCNSPSKNNVLYVCTCLLQIWRNLYIRNLLQDRLNEVVVPAWTKNLGSISSIVWRPEIQVIELNKIFCS